MMMSFICSCRNKKKEPSSIYHQYSERARRPPGVKPSRRSLTVDVWEHSVTRCVCWLFIFKDTEPSPLQDSSSVRQQGGLPGPPPRSPPPRIH